MAIRFHLRENVLNLAFRTDHERRARHSHHFLAVHVFFFHNAKGMGDFLIGIGQQRERKIVLFREFLLCRDCVGRDAEQRGPGFLNLTV
jgi:hypothetical protein